MSRDILQLNQLREVIRSWRGQHGRCGTLGGVSTGHLAGSAREVRDTSVHCPNVSSLAEERACCWLT